MDNAQEFASGAMEDFETYMMIARQGGTMSKLRHPDIINTEQDIKMTVVQNMLEEIGQDDNKKIWAIPVNTTFTRLEEIWEKLKQTRMHEIDNSDAAFSLSVMLRPYPCNVYSVWMYIAVFRNLDQTE